LKPKKATALLFYSQLGDGKMDDLSLHGACPVCARVVVCVTAVTVRAIGVEGHEMGC
jgi:hypothetical protein